MSANVDLEKVAALIGESIDFVRVNLQEGTLLIDGEPIGYAVKKKETQKNFFYIVDPIRFVKYIKELRKKLRLDCIITIRNVGYKLERK